MASAHDDDLRDLRIVLLGVSGAGKRAIANAILGREAFRESQTKKSEIQTGRIKDRNISIIDIPGFFNTQLTNEELQKEIMKSLHYCYPGPHMFLLIINLDTFIDDQRNIVEEIQENFGAEVLEFTMVLFTGREEMSSKEWKIFLLCTKFQELVSHCRNNYHAINSKNKINQAHITELLEKIDEFIKQNDKQHYNSEIHSTKSKKKQEEEKMYTGKQQEIKQKLAKTACETFTTHRVKEKRITHDVIEQTRESISEKKQQEEQYIYRQTEPEKVVTEEWAKKNSEIFEVESAMEERKTHIVTEEENESFVSYVSSSQKTSFQMFENLDNQSLHRFEEFSNERMRDETVGETPKKNGATSHKMSDQILSKDELRIVLVGKTGAGKSASGNTILGEKRFVEVFSSESVTRKCKKHGRIVDRQKISVIDTPGVFDTSISKEQLKEEIVKCFSKSAPGPHAFLLVIRLDVKFTDEEKNTVKWIQRNFGEDAEHYTIVLFTRGDQLKKSIEKFLKKNKQISEVVKQCGGRYHVFNNVDTNPAQVTELFEKIKRMVLKNGGEHYTNEMFKEAQRKVMMKKAKNTALLGASAAGVGAAVAGGVVLVGATGGVALPAVLMAGGAALTGGSGAAKVIAHQVKHIKEKKKNSKDEYLLLESEDETCREEVAGHIYSSDTIVHTQCTDV